MRIMSRVAVLGLFVMGTGAAQAFECDVKYKAKKVVSEKILFQEVKSHKLKSGTVTGEGSSDSACRSNALSPIKKQGWTITSSTIVRKR